MEQPDLLTSAEVAEILRVSAHQWAELLAYQPDALRPYWIGGQRRWDRDDVLKWLASTRGALISARPAARTAA